MANRAFKVSGNYTDYIVDGDAVASIDGDWVRIPADAKSVSIEVTLTDTASPVGAITIEGSNLVSPSGAGVVLALTAAAGGAVVQSIAASVLDGSGAKQVLYSADLSVNHPRWVRARWARSSGGTADLLNVRMNVRRF